MWTLHKTTRTTLGRRLESNSRFVLLLFALFVLWLLLTSTSNPNDETTQLPNDSTSIFFLHIPKTGGTSLIELMVPLMDARNKTTLRGPHFLTKSSNTADLVIGHTPFNESCLSSVVKGKKLLTFTIIRDPVSRLLSLYNFDVQPFMFDEETNNLTEEEKFLHWARLQPRNIQTAFLVGKGEPIHGFHCHWGKPLAGFSTLSSHSPNLVSESDLTRAKANLRDKFVTFGVTEKFTDFLSLLELTLGWKLSSKKTLPHSKPRNRNYKIAGVEQLSNSTVSQLRSLHAIDFRLHQFALYILEMRLLWSWG